MDIEEEFTFDELKEAFQNLHDEFSLALAKNKNLTKKLRIALEEKYEKSRKKGQAAR